MIGGSRGTRAREARRTWRERVGKQLSGVHRWEERRKREGPRAERVFVLLMSRGRPGNEKSKERRSGSMEFGSLARRPQSQKQKSTCTCTCAQTPLRPRNPVWGFSDFVRHEGPARHLWPQTTTSIVSCATLNSSAMSTAYSGSLQTKNRSAYVQSILACRPLLDSRRWG